MLKKFLTAVTVALIAVVVPFVSVPAAFADGVRCNLGNCSVTPPPTPGTPGGGSVVVSDPVTGFTPGPTSCFRQGAEATKENEIPCSDPERGAYQPDRGCYMKLADPQAAPPAGDTASDGAWYVCVDPPCKAAPAGGGALPCVTSVSAPRWLTTPPPGLNTLTPGQAAAALIKTFQLKGVEIGSTTEESGKGAVGLPVWLWVKNQGDALAWGPYEKSATLGGVTVTATARVANVAYSMGDGQTVVCANPGTVYLEGNGNTDSPTCGYRYATMSPSNGAQPYTITATSNWEVSWTATGGASGAIGTTTQGQTQARIGELQAVNVKR